MMGFSATVVVGIMLFAILLLDKTVTRPLRMLSKATDEFADPTVDYSQKKVINLPIKSKDEIGDLGIFMVKKSMDEVRYRRENGQNVFTMIKKW